MRALHRGGHRGEAVGPHRNCPPSRAGCKGMLGIERDHIDMPSLAAPTKRQGSHMAASASLSERKSGAGIGHLRQGANEPIDPYQRLPPSTGVTMSKRDRVIVRIGGNNDQMDGWCTCSCLGVVGSRDAACSIKVREACGVGMHRVNGVCIRTPARRAASRCARGVTC